jgi:hypothetical protein
MAGITNNVKTRNSTTYNYNSIPILLVEAAPRDIAMVKLQ